MGFRTVVIKNRAKLEHRLNFMVVRDDKEVKIFLDEINTLIVQSTAVSLTASLLNELTKRNVKVVFCDEKCNPSAELLPYYAVHNTSKRYKEQVAWTGDIKARVWQKIVRRKIVEQGTHLFEKGFVQQAEMLYAYASEVELNDTTNREGHSAKVYFNCILGDGESRSGGGFVNGCLNYGYSVLLSAFNREIVASGYLTQFGIWHDNEFNEFNLACDLMEPFRPVVDRIALSIPEKDALFKKKMANVLNCEMIIDGKKTTLDNAIKVYSRSVFRALESGEENLIIFPESISGYEL